MSMKLSKGKIVRTVDAVFEACGLCNYLKSKEKIAIPWKKKVHPTKSGYKLIMDFPAGKSIKDVDKAYDAIIVALNGADSMRYALVGTKLVMEIFDKPLATQYPFSSDYLEATRHTFKVPIMETLDGTIYHDFLDFPHLKIGGATRMGKSVLIKMIITTLLSNWDSSKMKLILLDGKNFVTFRKYENFPHVIAKGWNVKTALDALEFAWKAYEKRMDFLKESNVEDVAEYEEQYGIVLPHYFIFVDEGSMFRLKDAKGPEDKQMRKKYETKLENFSSLGAGPGFHLVYCTQRPDAETIPALVRSNIDATVAFRTVNQTNSEVLLDHEAAYKLPRIKGRAIYQTDETIVGQVPHLGNLRGWWILFELQRGFENVKDVVTQNTISELVEWRDPKTEQQQAMHDSDYVGDR